MATMLRRFVLEISSRKYHARVPRRITTQIPPNFSSRKEFSAASQQNTSQGPGWTGKPSNSGSFMSKLIGGGVVIGAAVMTAYQTGYLDQLIVEEQHESSEPAEKPAEEPAEEPAKEPAEEPAKDPAEEPAKDPAKTRFVDLGLVIPIPREKIGVVELLIVPVPKKGESLAALQDLRVIAGWTKFDDPGLKNAIVEPEYELDSDFPQVEDLREEKGENQVPVK